MIRHEDALRDQRLGWLFALDGFLFATVGFAWDQPHTTGLIWAIAAVGIVAGLSALASMRISSRAIRNLKEEAGGRGRVMGIQRDDSPFDDKLPWPTGWLFPWVWMPLALVVIWPVIASLHQRQFH
jgi:hypothetical protein